MCIRDRVLGGFHMFGMTAKRALKVAERLRKLGVEKVIPCHCTDSRGVWALGRLYDLSECVCRVGARFSVVA